MTYVDINVYLSGHGVNCKKETSDANSKWVYTKELLADVPPGTIIKIADELDIEHGYTVSKDLDLSESTFWKPGHFKLFLSHISAFKVKTAKLQKQLLTYGISGFVAHSDIEPTREWEIEIERALFSMDAFAAILTPGFKESNWTGQEVGIALGRDVLVIPIKKELDPYGFLGKFQALQGEGKTVFEVAEAIFNILVFNPKTKSKILGLLCSLLLSVKNINDAQNKINLLNKVDSIPETQLDRLSNNALSNPLIQNSSEIRSKIGELLGKHGRVLFQEKPEEQTTSYKIPF